jgi:hypothetical protein
MAAITDPNDPRLTDPAYASDPDVLAYLNSIYGPGGSVGVTPTGQTAPPSGATFNPGTQAYNPTGPVTDPHDPRLTDPAHATDPDVLTYLNGIYGPGGTVGVTTTGQNPPPAGSPGWNPQTQAWDPAPTAAVAPAGSGGGGGGGTAAAPPATTAGPPASGSPYYGMNIGDFTKPFSEQFAAPTPKDIPNAPVFTAPSFKTPDPFTAPTQEQAQNDPGYKFTLGQGIGALLNSRAAGGMLNSGATGKALVDYGQAAGSTQYGNVYNRDLGNYMTNYKTQYLDPYNNAFQNAQSEFAPKLTAWQTTAPMIQSQNNTDYANAMSKWLSDYNMYTQQQDRAFNKFNTVLGS